MIILYAQLAWEASKHQRPPKRVSLTTAPAATTRASSPAHTPKLAHALPQGGLRKCQETRDNVAPMTVSHILGSNVTGRENAGKRGTQLGRGAANIRKRARLHRADAQTHT